MATFVNKVASLLFKIHCDSGGAISVLLKMKDRRVCFLNYN
jgi:hypothetical protein